MKRIFLTCFTVFLLTMTPMLASAAGAVSELVTMVIHLNHYPSPAEKTALADIVADTHATAGEKAIAGALMRMQHRVEGGDADKLRSLAMDSSTPASEKELATILLGIVHHPSGADVARLKGLVR